jgi:hypothetical protein
MKNESTEEMEADTYIWPINFLPLIMNYGMYLCHGNPSHLNQNNLGRWIYEVNLMKVILFSLIQHPSICKLFLSIPSTTIQSTRTTSIT